MCDSESDMSDVLLLLETDLNSHRSIGLFILTIDLQYSAPSEIILTWNLKNLTICMTVALKFQKTKKNIEKSSEETSAIVSLCLFFLGSPKCNGHALRFAMRRRGCLNPLCTFPGSHWIRANIKCGHRKVGCLFKQEPSEGARWPLWKRGRNPTTRHRNIDTNIYRNPATIASLWSEALLGHTDQ